MKDSQGNNRYAVDPFPPPLEQNQISKHEEFYRRAALQSHPELIRIFMDENDLTEDVAASVVSTALENRDLLCGGHRRMSAGDVSLHQKYLDVEERAFICQRAYVKAGGCPIMSERCLWLLLRRHSLAGADNMADLGKKLDETKQAVNKCVKYFQERIPELPRLEGQRDEKARKEMANARIDQLKG